jgi:hypothetical protein
MLPSGMFVRKRNWGCRTYDGLGGPSIRVPDVVVERLSTGSEARRTVARRTTGQGSRCGTTDPWPAAGRVIDRHQSVTMNVPRVGSFQSPFSIDGQLAEWRASAQIENNSLPF